MTEYIVDGVSCGQVSEKIIREKWNLAIRKGWSWELSKDKLEVQTDRRVD